MALRKDAIMIDRSDVIKLIKVTETQDAAGVWRKSETSRDVFCHISSARMSEWMAAHQTGLRAGKVFTIFFADYQGEDLVEYQGERLSIYRTYQRQDEGLELHTRHIKGVDYENN